jgi:DNA-directed RNA polymerase beta subunit
LDTFDEEFRVFEGISLGKLPVMLGSSLCLLKDYPMTLEQMGECGHDPLGYFIIHGSERTILCQEKVADNRIMVFQSKKTSSKHTYSVEMKSLHESMMAAQRRLLAPLSPRNQEVFLKLLSTLVDANNEYSRAPTRSSL